MESYTLSVARASLYLVLLLSAYPVIAAMVVGLIISLFQATTQIQEQTLTFVPKLVAVIMVLIFLGPLGMAQMIEFTKTLLEGFPTHFP
jgi:flagellar biosynthetic protein FliQ